MSQNVLKVEKKNCPRIQKSCSIEDTWGSVGPLVASRFGGPEFLPVPYLLDANAYGIGHVFLPVTTKTGCIRSNSTLRIIGPIKNFVIKTVTNPKWYESNFPAVKNDPKNKNLQVKLGSGNRRIVFTANNYYYLSKPENMVATRDVTIDRSSHEDLTDAKWIGLISEVVASDVFQMEITAKLCGRTFYVGDSGTHTFLFKYEMYKLDESGSVRHVMSDTKEFKSMKWEPVDKTKRDKLPLSSIN